MPQCNRFQHQSYSASEPTGMWGTLCPQVPADSTPSHDAQNLSAAGQSYRSAGVQAVYLVHGTFAGNDAIGVIRGVSRIAPDFGASLRQLYKSTIDKIAGDIGNYSAEYARRFEQIVAVPVRQFHWSSENQHVARAHAAVCLIDELAAGDYGPNQRVLLWGHSHAGNVFALITNLLAAGAAVRDLFFAASRSYYRWPLGGRIDLPVWARVRQLLDAPVGTRPLPILDMVTFGTPIRYGWDTAGYAKLLHFVHHRPLPGIPVYRTALPTNPVEVLAAVGGDYVQHWGIAGTNLPPDAIAWRTWLAELKLGKLFQGGLRSRDLLKHLQAGMRVAAEGRTLLVDYGDSPQARLLAGHAVYTLVQWLPFHVIEVARQFYGLRSVDP